MEIHGLDSVRTDLEHPGYFFKCIADDRAAVFFPGSIQHRDMKQAGLSYEDDYRGNALAVTITPGRMDVRFHKAFTDERVRTIFRQLLANIQMTWASGFSVAYQGRDLIAGRPGL